MSDAPGHVDAREHPAAAAWPFARIRVVTPRLELRLPTEGDLAELGRVAAAGIHDPAEMPFASPWSDAAPREIAEGMMQAHWSGRAEWKTGTGWVMLAVYVDGRPVGCQDMRFSQFAVTREVSSGSWLGRSVHGQGLGTEMRQAMLHLAFAGMDAQLASSGAYVDNAASIRVSEKCGYEPNGVIVWPRRRGEGAPGGASVEAAEETRYRLTRERWAERRRDDIELHGVDADVRRMLGLDPTA